MIADAFCGDVVECSWLNSTGADCANGPVCLSIGGFAMFVGSMWPTLIGEVWLCSFDIRGVVASFNRNWQKSQC